MRYDSLNKCEENTRKRSKNFYFRNTWVRKEEEKVEEKGRGEERDREENKRVTCRAMNGEIKKKKK